MGQIQIGLMQGRLLPPVDGKIQAFPGDSWESEFLKAQAIDHLNHIEWILESPLESNPFWDLEGQKKIKEVAQNTKIGVPFVCADFFMASPFVRMSKDIKIMNRKVLCETIKVCSSLGIKGVEIPMVDSSRINSLQEEDELAEALQPCLKVAEKYGVFIGLETSLNPERFRKLLDKIGHAHIKANYDTGNSASLGYNMQEEISAYGSYINNVHLKDRKLTGGTVPFGRGNADIPKAIQLFQELGYQGVFILQGARQPKEEPEVIKEYINYIFNNQNL
jgi:L-ribulose-5-phosphate 3-epimerase